MNIITDKNKKVINYDEIIHVIESSFDSSELTALLQDLQRHLSMNDISLYEAKVLMGSITNKLKLLSSPELLDSLTRIKKQNESAVKKMTFLPTSVSNRAGIVSNVLLIFNIILVIIMFTLLFISKIAR